MTRGLLRRMTLTLEVLSQPALEQRDNLQTNGDTANTCRVLGTNL